MEGTLDVRVLRACGIGQTARVGDDVRDDNVFRLQPKFEVLMERQKRLDGAATILRTLAHAIRRMRERGADSKEIARVLRLAATDLDPDGDKSA